MGRAPEGGEPSTCERPSHWFVSGYVLVRFRHVVHQLKPQLNKLQAEANYRRPHTAASRQLARQAPPVSTAGKTLFPGESAIRLAGDWLRLPAIRSCQHGRYSIAACCRLSHRRTRARHMHAVRLHRSSARVITHCLQQQLLAFNNGNPH